VLAREAVDALAIDSHESAEDREDRTAASSASSARHAGAENNKTLRESVSNAARSSGTYVDATFGRGGHTRLMLSRLGPGGRLVALDRDEDAIAAGRDIGDPRLLLLHARFGELARVLEQAGVAAGTVSGVLVDLGVSSPQLDQAERGFSFRADGPLDMRMDRSSGLTAAQWLAEADEGEIREVIKEYGEERFAKQIAKAIVAARAGRPLLRTRQLADLVGQAVRTREPGQDPATRTFQALRIFINQELEELPLMLPQALAALAPGGRLAVISFHSLEDRIVKRFMRDNANPDNLPARLPVKAADLPPPRLRILGKPVRASAAELAQNPRARSATLRVAEKAGNT
jgi:16S rRNA (cytosine1402-N4)-methyltransferase